LQYSFKFIQISWIRWHRFFGPLQAQRSELWMASDSKPHKTIVFLALGTRGDVQPCLALALALAAKGDVRCVLATHAELQQSFAMYVEQDKEQKELQPRVRVQFRALPIGCLRRAVRSSDVFGTSARA